MPVKIKTSIPGPKSIMLAERRANSVAQGHGTVCNVYIEKAEGIKQVDVIEAASKAEQDRHATMAAKLRY